MNRRKSRPLELVRRVFVYALMVAAISVLVVLLTLKVLGYQFNFNTRTVERTGLVQYDSFPRGALVSIDGKSYENTQTKSMVLPGQHQFAMSLKGYEDWQKTQTISAGTVTWLSYVRLVPTEKRIASMHTFDNIGSTLASPDHRFMAGTNLSDVGDPQLVLIDFRDSRQPKVTGYKINTEKLTGYDMKVSDKHELSIVEWSNSSKYILIKHVYNVGDGDKTEWLWVDREVPSVVVNITTLLNLPLKSVHITDEKTAYVLQENGDVRRADIDSGNISRPLISDVKSFNTFGNEKISFVGETKSERTAGIWKRGWDQPTIITTLPLMDNQQLNIDLSTYFFKDTVVVTIGQTLTIYRGDLPNTEESRVAFVQTGKKFTLNRNVTDLEISNNGRFIFAEDRNGFVSYDLEQAMISQELKKSHPNKVRWIDDYHTWQVDESGQLVMQEFDGVNSYQLMPADPSKDVLLTQDGRYLYAFALNDKSKLELTQLSMIAKN